MRADLILIRHGQADRASKNYLRAPLTALGRAQATLTGRYLREAQEKVDAFYSSPLVRARETAVLIGGEIGLDPSVKSGLQEMMSSELLPIIILETMARIGLFHDYLLKNVGKPQRWPIVGRVSTVLTELMTRHPDQSIALVTHGGVISGTLAWYMPQERRRWWRETVGNCSLTRLRVEGTAAELTLFNDTRHLVQSA